MSLLSQFFQGSSKGSQTGSIGQYGVGLATNFSKQLPIDLMIIGGGGGGGGAGQQPYIAYTSLISANADRVMAGGGGAGRGLVYTNLIVDVGTTYPITVGAGGVENSRGGTTSFGLIKAGGGGAGGGSTPAGVEVTPDFGGLYGGSQGGSGISTTTSALNGGGAGIAPFADAMYSVTTAPSAMPAFGYSANGSLTSSNNLFKQSVNSTSYPFVSFPGTGASGGGTGDIGATPAIGIVFGSASDLFSRWGLPAALSPAPRSFYSNSTTSAIALGPPVGAYSPVPSYSTYTVQPFPFIAPSPATPGYTSPTAFNVLNSPGSGSPIPGIMGRFYTGTNAPAGGSASINAIPFNASPLLGDQYRYIPAGGGNITARSIPVPIQGFSIVPTSGIGKTVSAFVTPLSFTGSPGNGGGGSGGFRHAPVFMSGTMTVPYVGPAGPLASSGSSPYTFTIPGSTTPMASGGAGGSGSVWVIYPSDYAAATVTGNTPVPSPPAIRVYRWDGAGTITFNAS